MKTWIMAIAGVWASWVYMDIRSESSFESIFLPFVFFICLLTLVLKITWMVAPKKAGGACGDNLDFFDGGGGDC